MKKVYRGWNPTQVFGDYFINIHKPWNKDPVIKQPGFNGTCGVFFSRGSCWSGDVDTCWHFSRNTLRLKAVNRHLDANKNRCSVLALKTVEKLQEPMLWSREFQIFTLRSVTAMTIKYSRESKNPSKAPPTLGAPPEACALWVTNFARVCSGKQDHSIWVFPKIMSFLPKSSIKK